MHDPWLWSHPDLRSEMGYAIHDPGDLEQVTQLLCALISASEKNEKKKKRLLLRVILILSKSHLH